MQKAPSLSVRPDLEGQASDVQAMLEAYANVAKAPRDMHVRRMEAALFAIYERIEARLSVAASTEIDV